MAGLAPQFREVSSGIALAVVTGMVRGAALLVAWLGIAEAAIAGPKTASMRIGAQVVASVRLSATATVSSLGVETRSFGCSLSAVFVQQRSGPPLRLRGGGRLPGEADAPLVMVDGSLQLAPRRAAGSAEVVVTVFTDGTPPHG